MIKPLTSKQQVEDDPLIHDQFNWNLIRFTSGMIIINDLDILHLNNQIKKWYFLLEGQYSYKTLKWSSFDYISCTTDVNVRDRLYAFFS